MSTTVNEIAEKCGVSRTTVIRALNNQARISDATRKHILEVAQELGYRPNLLARSLNSGRTKMIGMVSINMDNMVFVESLSAINKEVNKKGYSFNIALNGENLDAEKQHIQEFVDRRMDGILLSPVNFGSHFSAFLSSLNTPVVCIGNYVSDLFTTIMVDEAQATKDAVQLMLSKGYRKIIFICPPLALQDKRNVYSHVQRASGFQEEMSRHPEIESSIITGEDYIDQLNPVLSSLNTKTALLCSGDIYALNIMRYFKGLKIHTPDDIGIMGFDNISMLDFIVPRLTTISTNIEKVASVAVNELLDCINNPEYVVKRVILPHEILDMETL